MINSDSSSTSSWLPPHNIVDSLNQVMDSVSVLSDAELQKELSIFANAQFTYDVAPGTALEEEKINKKEKQFRRESKQPNMHSLLNVKLASLAEHNYHTTMTPDAIDSYYDQSPDCSPPNGYYSPNPSPPNGFHSPNPTPPNGYLANNNSPAVFNGIQGIVNPPITFYGDETVMGYDEDQFMKTMNILTTSYNEPQHYDHLDNRPPSTTEKRKSFSTKKQRSNSVSTHSASIKKSSPLSKKDLPAVESDLEDEDIYDNDNENDKKNPLTKEDKRRRNTAASARFRVKKKLREQALQQTAQEMTEKAKAFETRVHELEREVKWLKALIVERKDGRLEQMIDQQQQQHHHQQHREVHYQQQYRSNVAGHHHVSASIGNSNNGYLPVEYHGQQQ